MPLKVSVGLSKKAGLPDYGSVGASCHVEVELDSTLLQQNLEGFQQQVRRAYVACAQAVNDELARQHDNRQAVPQAREEAPAPTNGSSRNGKAGDRRRASEKQLDYAQKLAGQVKGLGTRQLATLTQKMFRKPLADLSGLEASSLIDTFKEFKAGSIKLGTALNGDSP
jgi:hypothetical protein